MRCGKIFFHKRSYVSERWDSILRILCRWQKNLIIAAYLQNNSQLCILFWNFFMLLEKNQNFLASILHSISLGEIYNYVVYNRFYFMNLLHRYILDWIYFELVKMQGTVIIFLQMIWDCNLNWFHFWKTIYLI